MSYRRLRPRTICSRKFSKRWFTPKRKAPGGKGGAGRLRKSSCTRNFNERKEAHLSPDGARRAKDFIDNLRQSINCTYHRLSIMRLRETGPVAPIQPPGRSFFLIISLRELRNPTKEFILRRWRSRRPISRRRVLSLIAPASPTNQFVILYVAGRAVPFHKKCSV